MVAGFLAAVAAGPWPFAPGSVGWRVPVACIALAATWRAWPRLGRLLAGPVAAALLVDGALPAVQPSATVARKLGERTRAVAMALADVAQGEELRELFLARGGAVDPEVPFVRLEALARTLPPLDTVVVIDESGELVAWTGRAARLPVRLRLLGDPAVVAEPGYRQIHLWWRVPVLDQGRQVGALLASVALPEHGSRRALGVWAGRAAALRLQLPAAAPLDPRAQVVGPGGAVVGSVRVLPSSPVWWSTPGLAVVVALLLAGRLAPRPWRRWVVLAAFVLLQGVGGGPRGWWVVLAVAAGAAALGGRGEGLWVRGSAALVAGGVAYLLPSVLAELGAPVGVGSLVVPAPMVVLLLVALTVLLGVPAGGGRGMGWWAARLVGWSLLLVGLATTHVAVVGIGVALAVFAGTPGRSVTVSALVAAVTVMTAWDAMQRMALVATTESTLALVADAEGPARRFLASLPESGLHALAGIGPAEALVVLGRQAEWSGLEDVLPGTALVLRDAEGAQVTAWGPVPPAAGALRVLARRTLRAGGSLDVVAPVPPYDVLESLAARGIDAPLAVYDQRGAPHGRGATFRPLPPEVVGQALASGRSWRRVGVGEREFRAYARACGDSVLVVPWLRAPRAERALVLAGLALWGGVPVWLRRNFRHVLGWWGERTTFVGKTRLVTVAAALVPMVVLGSLLSVQWLRQQHRSRLEFGRAVAAPLVQLGWDRKVAELAHEMGGAAGMYRGGRLAASSRPDLVVRGDMPAMPPRTAYVRAIRGWGEPAVDGEGQLRVYVAAVGQLPPTVLGIVGIPAASLSGSSPVEWFVVTGALAFLSAFWAAEMLGRRLSRPLRTVVQAAERLARGERFEELPPSGDEDVAALERAFAAMAAKVERREEELRAERDLLETVLGTLSAAVVVSKGERVELANPAARALLGGGESIACLDAHFGGVLGELLATATGGRGEERVVHPPKSPERLWRVTVRPLDQPTTRVLVVLEDLSEVARAERLASLAELARIVAHEVKNPLTPIRLWAEELRETLAKDPQTVVEVARLATEQILERVEHLKAVSQGFSNLVALERWNGERVGLGALAREVVGEYRVLAKRGITLLVEATAEVEVVADAEWLRRAVRHLLDNSARALAGRGGTIVVRVAAEGATAVLTVHDTGGGVPEAHLPRLFEPFFSTTTDGSGLGLAVVRRVAERAGGWVEARNAKGGLEVRLEIPRLDPASRDAASDG